MSKKNNWLNMKYFKFALNNLLNMIITAIDVIDYKITNNQ